MSRVIVVGRLLLLEQLITGAVIVVVVGRTLLLGLTFTWSAGDSATGARGTVGQTVRFL